MFFKRFLLILFKLIFLDDSLERVGVFFMFFLESLGG